MKRESKFILLPEDKYTNHFNSNIFKLKDNYIFSVLTSFTERKSVYSYYITSDFINFYDIPTEQVESSELDYINYDSGDYKLSKSEISELTDIVTDRFGSIYELIGIPYVRSKVYDEFMVSTIRIKLSDSPKITEYTDCIIKTLNFIKFR